MVPPELCDSETANGRVAVEPNVQRYHELVGQSHESHPDGFFVQGSTPPQEQRFFRCSCTIRWGKVDDINNFPRSLRVVISVSKAEKHTAAMACK